MMRPADLGSRHGPFEMLDGKRKPLWDTAVEWRKSLWKRWLLSHVILGEEPRPSAVNASCRSSTEPVAGPKDATSAESAADSASGPPVDGSRGRSAVPAESPPASVLGSAGNGLRGRFEALTDRFLAVEESLEALNRRLARREYQAHRGIEQVVELLDRSVVSAERQGEALAASVELLHRLEHRLERLEENMNRTLRTSTLPPARPTVSDEVRPEAERLASSAWYGPSGGQPASSPPRDIATVHGRLSEMSLPTVLAMFEFERRTGRLTIEAQSGERLCVSLHNGSLLSSRINEREVRAVDALRQAIDWREGSFWFEPIPIDPADAAPQSIGSLLIEATRQNDEAARAG